MCWVGGGTVGLFSLQGRKGTAVARRRTRVETGKRASASRGAGPKLGAPGDLEIGLGVEMGPSIAGGSKVEGTSFIMVWVEMEAGGSEDPGPRLCM